MGSKNLLAVALRGHLPVEVAQPEAVRSYGKDLSRRSLGAATEKYRNLGTIANVAVFNRLGALPTRNFRQSTFEGSGTGQRRGTAPQSPAAQYRLRQLHHRLRANPGVPGQGSTKGKGKGGVRMEGVRMEYESLFALGPLCGVSDPDVVIRAAAICDDLGMDTISAGATVAWAMECFRARES